MQIVAQDREGLVLWPLHEVAMLREEHAGRLEVLHASGALAHTTGPVAPQGPLVLLAPGIAVNPHLARQEGADMVLPGGWRLPGALPPSGPAPEEPGEQILYLEVRYGRQTWVTDRGRRPWTGTPAEEGVRAGLLDLGGSRLLHVPAVRAVQRGNRLVLVDGSSFALRPAHARVLAEHLGLRNLREAGLQTDTHRALFRNAVRDWPVPLLHAEDAWLRQEFHADLPRLLANLIWQVFRLRRAGGEDDYGRDHRGLFYTPVLLVVARAGLLGEWATSLGPEPQALSPKDRVWVAMLKVLDRMVMDDRLFTFRELGFDDARPELRHLGTRNPHVVLLAEKATLRRAVHAMGERFGLSWLILGGQPSSFGTELFADLVRAVVAGRPLLVLALVDFDPAGWIIAEAFCRQAERFGLVIQDLRFLVRPQRFTPQELQRIALPLEAGTPAEVTKNRRWMRKSGGVMGQEKRIYADSLRPESRVERAVLEESGLP